MSDILIRDRPADVLAAIEAEADKLGLTRTEYLRHALSRGQNEQRFAVTTDDLAVFVDTFSDVGDHAS